VIRLPRSFVGFCASAGLVLKATFATSLHGQAPEFLRFLVSSDPHPPSKWRVNGPLSNMPEFKAAWGCKDTDSMVRPAADRPHIW